MSSLFFFRWFGYFRFSIESMRLNKLDLQARGPLVCHTRPNILPCDVKLCSGQRPWTVHHCGHPVHRSWNSKCRRSTCRRPWALTRWKKKLNRKIVSNALACCYPLRSTSTTTTSTGRRRSLCVAGTSVHGSRSPSRPSTCWWSTCADTPGRSRTNAR